MDLKEMREYAGFTQEELARLISGTKNSYNKYRISYMEGGHRSQEGKIGLNLLKKLATACGCEVVVTFKVKEDGIQS
jgi:transcriptional regulator with XRE-family HTH domain